MPKTTDGKPRLVPQSYSVEHIEEFVVSRGVRVADLRRLCIDLAKKLSPDAPKTNREDPILTLRECGDRFGKTRQTVGRWVKEGLLTPVKMPSGLPGVRESEVNKFLGATSLQAIE